MTLDSYLPQQMETVRRAFAYVLTPVRSLASSPTYISKSVNNLFADKAELLAENDAMRSQILILERQNQKLASLQAENQRMRDLLGASQLVDERVLAAEILALDTDPFSHKVIINKGAEDGVRVGQPVIDALGVFGQVVSVEAYTSRVLLVADVNAALPVQINRNGVRAIAIGSGQLGQINLVYVPNTADVEVGDLVVTSGLGGRFPEGYPVAEVILVEHPDGEDFARIVAHPRAALDRSRHLLLLIDQGGVNGQRL